jgi:hypothetical protein
VVLPDASACARLRTALALGAIADSMDPAPASVVATIIAPAAGICGPALAGPVDAVQDDGRHDGRTSGRWRVPWSASTLSVQQSRCWLASATFLGSWPDGCVLDSGLAVLPSVVGRDTARATQFQLDQGRGVNWPEVLLLRPPTVRAGGVDVLAAYTDGLLTSYLLDRALAGERALVA